MRRNLCALLLAACQSAPTSPHIAPPVAVPIPVPVPVPAEPERVIPDELSDADLAYMRNMGAGFGGRPTPCGFVQHGERLLYLRSSAHDRTRRLYVYDLANGASEELITPDQLLKGAAERLSPEERARRERMRVSVRGFATCQPSRDGKSVLLDLAGGVYLLSLATKKVIEAAHTDAFDPSLAPDGRKIAFVRGGEVWVSIEGRATQLTHGATPTLTHGIAEFVAQEEMDRYTGHWWSGDSQLVVYAENDTTGVERMTVNDPSDPTDLPEPTPYPRPGRKNVEVRLGIVPAAGGKTTWIVWDREKDPYVARVSWEPSAPLAILVETRDQHDLALLGVDPKTGATHELVHEHDDVWLNLPIAYAWLPAGKGFIWSTERRGAWTAELRKPSGELVRELSTPELGLAHLIAVDFDASAIIVATRRSPLDRSLVRIPLDGSAAKPRFTDDDPTPSALFDGDSAAYLRYRGADRVPEVHRPDGSVAGTLPSAADPLPPIETHVEVAQAGPLGAWTAVVRPKNFDPKKKYAVLDMVYGGPGTDVVAPPSSREYARHQWIADHGYIVVAIDGRGTPSRGRAWERAIYQKFSTVILDDQVTALQALAEREPAMDMSRVGISGESFGGYLAALAVLRRPDVFAAAVAESPVSDWLDYDTYYTEHCLGVPDLHSDESRRIYDQNGLLEFAPSLSRPLLILHGTTDDNVHFSHALHLADALFRAGRRFELVPLLGQTHMIGAALMSVQQAWFAFFRASLR